MADLHAGVIASILCSASLHKRGCLLTSIDCLPFTIYHLPPWFLSLRKEEPLPELSPQTPVSSYTWHPGPRWRIRLSLNLVLGHLCRLVHSRGVHPVTVSVYILYLNRAHPCMPIDYGDDTGRTG